MPSINEMEEVKIKALEQSLVNFLMDKKDTIERSGTSVKRVRMLQLRFDGTVPEHPLFIVQIGILEAEFDALTGMKEKGSCYGLERYIRDWSERESIKNELISLCAETSKSLTLAKQQSSKLTDNIGFII